MVITEIGGTVGDIESLPFLEAIRQFRQEVGRDNAIFIHLTLVPYIAAAGELKTKPTQHSVRDLMQIGIQPDILICRSEQPISADIKRKIALFCNVDFGCVVESPDVRSIYEIPLRFLEQGLDREVCQRLRLETKEPDLRGWKAMTERILHPTNRVRIAVVGKYTALHDAYKSVERGADPRRHPARRQGGGRVDPERPVHRPGGGGPAARGVRRAADPGRLRRARGRGDDRGDPLGAGERPPVLRHLPRPAGRDHRVRPQRLRHARDQQHRVRARLRRRRSSR